MGKQTKNKLTNALGCKILLSVIVLLGVVLCMDIIYASQLNSWCYQETANISTACGGLSTGRYDILTTDANSVYNGVNITYDIPDKVTNLSWMIREGNGNIINLSLTEKCYNYSFTERKVILQVVSSQSGITGNSNYSCYNGTGFEIIYNLPDFGSSGVDLSITAIQPDFHNLIDGIWDTGWLYDKTTPQPGRTCNITNGTAAAIIWEEGIFWETNYLKENSILFNSTTYETAKENFIINITYDNSYYTAISANLIYNGTSYVGTKSGSGSNVLFTKALDIALTNITQNRSFYWTVTLYNGTSSEYYNSTRNNQTVNPIQLDFCNSTLATKSLNFTAFNEENLTRILSYDFDAVFNYYLGTGTIYKTKYLSNHSTFEVNLCINPNRTFYIDGQVNYDAPGKIDRNYFFDNDDISNITQHFNLMLLDSTSSTTFIIKVQDINYNAVADALVYIERYYPGTDEYKVVQVVKTDDNGKSVGFYKTETVEYRHRVVKDGVELLLTEKGKVFAESTPYTITLTVGDAYDIPWQELQNKTDIAYSLTFNKTTKIVTYTFIDSNADYLSSNLLVYQIKFSTGTNLSCNVTSVLASSTMTCNLSSYESGSSFEAKAYRITSDGRELIALISFEIEDSIETFGTTGLILAWFIILTASMIFLWSPIAGCWATTMSMIFVNLIGLAKLSKVWIFALLCISIIITIVIGKDR